MAAQHRAKTKRSAITGRNRAIYRSVWVILLALLGAVWFGASSTMTTVLKLVAAVTLFMGGTDHPLSVPPDTQPFVNNYVTSAQNNYLVPGGFCPATGCTTVVAVVTPEQFFPLFGTMTFDQSVAQGVANLNNCVQGSVNCVTNQAVPGTSPPPYSGSFVIYGYSQSATIATLEKRNLAAELNPPATSFFLLENPNRPNGGILARAPGLTIPFLGVTFSGPTPTNTSFPTIDVARQYDGIADAPLNPLNLLSDINAGFGYVYLHGAAPSLNLSDAQFQGQFGDTSYYLIPTQTLPLLMPLAQLGVPAPLLAVLDAPLRVLVEAGYNRTISPGQPTPINLLYVPNPIALVINLVVSIPTGLDNGLSQLGLGRPLGTPVPGPYGVGGPPVDPAGPPGPAPAPLASTVSTPTTTLTSNTITPTTNTTPPVAAAALATTTTPAVTPATSTPTTQPASSPPTSTRSTTKPSPTTSPTTNASTAPTTGRATPPQSTTGTNSTSNSSQSSTGGSSSSSSSSSSGSSSSTK